MNEMKTSVNFYSWISVNRLLNNRAQGCSYEKTRHTHNKANRLFWTEDLKYLRSVEISAGDKGCLPFTQTTRMEIFGINTK